jgi:hypothetical protein
VISILTGEQYRGVRPVCLSDNPDLTLHKKKLWRNDIYRKEPTTALQCRLITVLILLTTVSPVTPKMTSDTGTNKSKKWLVLAGCIKYARSLDQLTGMKS